MSTTKLSQNAGLKKTTTVLQTALKQATLNFITSHKDDIYPHLTDDESVYELDEFDYMLENNDNIPDFNN